MLSLGIDTSTRTGFLALVEDERLLLEETIDAELNHSARLLPALESAMRGARLSLTDLDCIGVGVGPGSLTGVRVALAFGKGLRFAVPKPLVGVCSLEAIAYRRGDYAGIISVVLDAKMGGFYHAAYRFRISDFGFRIGDIGSQTSKGSARPKRTSGTADPHSAPDVGSRIGHLGPETCKGAARRRRQSAIRNPQSAIEQVSPLCVLDREELQRKLTPGSLILSPDPLCDLSDLSGEVLPVFPSAEYIAYRAILEVTSGTFDPKEMLEPIYLRPGVPRKAKPR